jgi:hypothetical protein
MVRDSYDSYVLITTCDECESIIADHSPIEHDDTDIRFIPGHTSIRKDSSVYLKPVITWYSSQ